MDFNTITSGAIPVVLTGVLVEVVKRAGIEGKFLPLLSLFFGVCVSFLFGWAVTPDLAIAGLIYGAIASGLYDHIPATTAIVKSE